jgi:hypothetical protein
MAAGDLIVDYLDTSGVHQTLTQPRSQFVFNVEGVQFNDGVTYFFQPWGRVLEIHSDEAFNAMFRQ